MIRAVQRDFESLLMRKNKTLKSNFHEYAGDITVAPFLYFTINHCSDFRSVPESHFYQHCLYLTKFKLVPDSLALQSYKTTK